MSPANLFVPSGNTWITTLRELAHEVGTKREYVPSNLKVCLMASQISHNLHIPTLAASIATILAYRNTTYSVHVRGLLNCWCSCVKCRQLTSSVNQVLPAIGVHTFRGKDNLALDVDTGYAYKRKWHVVELNSEEFYFLLAQKRGDRLPVGGQ